MPISDIPIILINLALLAIIALPFVIAFSVVYAARHIVRPLWALRFVEAHKQEHSTPLPSPLPESEREKDRERRRIQHSAFGR